jgi:RNase adapter protein RapZ
VRGQALYPAYIERVESLLDLTLPGYVAEGKSYLTIAVGCTGGHHRSVVVAADLAAWIRARGLPTVLVHRDVERA